MIPPSAFPLLTSGNHKVTSPTSRAYNCIAWAAGDQQKWWWPDAQGVGYWPAGVPRRETIDALLDVFRTLGYEVCEDAHLEHGFEKVVIYALGGRPTHAARQLENGQWSTKLGIQEDIEHEPGALEGPAYGAVVGALRRPRVSERGEQ